MTDATVLEDISDQVATITLNRPDRLNALTRQVEEELAAAMQRADESEDVRVIILTGAGRGFCAGADMESLGEIGSVDWENVDLEELKQQIVPPVPRPDTAVDFQKKYSYFPAISKPVIGAINGAAVGLGFILPLYCDIRIASDKARFGTAFAQRGLIAEHGVSWMLPRLVGISNALDLLYSARLIDAEIAFGRLHDRRAGRLVKDEAAVFVSNVDHANVVVRTIVGAGGAADAGVVVDDDLAAE